MRTSTKDLSCSNIILHVVGLEVGADEGVIVGVEDGCAVGALLGKAVGAREGPSEGDDVGAGVGATVGEVHPAHVTMQLAATKGVPHCPWLASCTQVKVPKPSRNVGSMNLS